MTHGLLPDESPVGGVKIDRELPGKARKWGRVLDTSELLPGDLILIRNIRDDPVSRRIVEAQLKGGLHKRHAQWTHAAVFLGDGEHICEANFKVAGLKWGVNVRSIFDYCDEDHAVRARRPKVLDENQRIRISIGAMTNLGKGYDFGELLRFRWAALQRKGFWQGNQRKSINVNALICSTLYQDAYNFSFVGNAVRMGSLCTPAHLSASTDFEPGEPVLAWHAIT